MIQDRLDCPTPKQWQVEAIATLHSHKNAVVVLSYPPGAGKTKAIQGAAIACMGVTLLLCPTVTLTSFMDAVNKDVVECVNLDAVKSDGDVESLQEKLRSLRKLDQRKLRSYIIVTSPRTLVTKLKTGIDSTWCKFFCKLAKAGVLRLIVNDEAHQTTLHGRTFRLEYEKMGALLFKPIAKLEVRPKIALVSATLRDKILQYQLRLWGIKVTDEIRATPKLMSRRDVKIHLHVRQVKDATTKWKKIAAKFLEETKENHDKLIVFGNFKCRMTTLREHLYDAAGFRKDFYVHLVDGDTDSDDKTAVISTFCDRIDHDFCEKCLSMVICASTGAEGYDCSRIRLILRQGMPGSWEQLLQELGRIRMRVSSYSDYHMFISMSDYAGMRKIRRKKGTRDQEWSISLLNEVLQLVLGSKCWYSELERVFGRSTSEDPEDFLPTSCGNCPGCHGDVKDESVAVDREELKKYLVQQLVSKGRLDIVDEFVNVLWANDAVCQKLYRLKKKSVPRFKVECLALQLSTFGIVRVDDKKVDGEWKSFASLNFDGLTLEMNNDQCWSNIKLLE